MTDADKLALDERISLMIEPKPKEWQLDALYLRYKAWVHLDKVWQPIPWTRSEEANARLLEAMPWPALKRASLTIDESGWRCSSDMGEYLQAADRKTAIALAFEAYFNGLSPEAQEQCRKEIAK